jgi:hypothetical protein
MLVNTLHIIFIYKYRQKNPSKEQHTSILDSYINLNQKDVKSLNFPRHTKIQKQCTTHLTHRTNHTSNNCEEYINYKCKSHLIKFSFGVWFL